MTAPISPLVAACPLALGPFHDAARKCNWCGCRLVGRQRRWCPEHRDTFTENHLWSWARVAALRSAEYRCRVCGTPHRLEVNHKVPILGRHGEAGCHHHQEGLEVLCHEHHLIVTAEQFGRTPPAERVARAMGTVPLFDYPDGL